MIKIFCLLAFTILILKIDNPEKHQVKTITLSKENPVIINGKIEADWKEASVFEMTNGGKVCFKYDGTYLYVGIQGIKEGWNQVYLAEGESSDVSVIHASAALARTFYKQDATKKWQPSNPFLAELRDKSITDETKRKMDDYLSKNNWVANNIYMGNRNGVEFKLKPKNGSNKMFHINVIWVSDSLNPSFFPDTLDDDSRINQKLVEGWMPGDVNFNMNQWAVINLK